MSEVMTTAPDGRDLDGMVAELVMGYKWMTVDEEGLRHLAMLMSPNERLHPKWIETLPSKEAGDWCARVPHYSTDIAAAWQVLEHFRCPLYWTRMTRTLTGNWRCDIELNNGDGPMRSASRETAPLAICWAAIAAVGGV